MRIISIDSGSSFLKAYDGERTLRFPSAVLELHEWDPSNGDMVETLGRRWLVGESVLATRREPDLTPHRERWFHGSEEQHVQICHALSRLGVSGDQDTLLLTLPYLQAREERFREAVMRRTSFAWKDASGSHEVNFGRIRVTPQGVGALRLYQHEKTDESLSLVMLVDIGACTTDIVTVRRMGGRWHFIDDASTSLQDRPGEALSTTGFFNLWREELSRVPGFAGRDWTYFGLMDRISELWVRHHGEQVPIKAEFMRASATFTRSIRKAVADAAGPIWGEVDRVILTGGGAALIDRTVWEDVRLHQMDVLANVRGQFHHTAQTGR